MVDVEVAPWLKGIPLAPEYHPSEAECADPITFVLRIEEVVRQFGICKVVPPFARQSKKSVVYNLERCFVAAQGNSATRLDGNSLGRNKFTTQRQRVGWDRDDAPLKGGCYTLEQFEAKSKEFARGKLGTSKEVPPLAVETLFWQSIEQDKRTFVEYASGIRGSAFPENETETADARKRTKGGKEKEPVNPTDGSWNMRHLSQSQGSLFRFMPNPVPGVTVPALFISMLYSWSAWHTDDHELHTLSYLHIGAPKTWYAVPPEAVAAFEDVVRVHGYNNLEAARERTTRVSPELLVSNGVPCCRLVQNPGEYVVVLPRSYTFNFSHGFNSGESCNVATPGWLKVAKQVAAQRVAANRPLVLRHEQLLYQAAQAFSKSSIASDIRSSRLKHKMKLCIDEAVKTEFVNDFLKSRQLLVKLGSMPQTRCIVLNEKESGKQNLCNLVNLGTIDSISLLSFVCESMESLGGKDSSSRREAPAMDWGALSCAVCGILCFSCIGIIQPASDTSKDVGRCSRKRSRENGDALSACVLCAEHALQVNLLLQGLGGSKVLIVCHPEYQRFETSAKQIAREMNMEFRPKGVHFEKGNEEDFHFLRTATDTGEWAKRLAVGQGTAKLNENEDSDDPVSDEENVVEKKLKEKKCWIVGRWCGRAWRYDQAHSLLGGCISPKKDAVQSLKKKPSAAEERQQMIDELTSFKKNYRKRRRTQLASCCKTDSEPQSECTAPPPANLKNGEDMVINEMENKTHANDTTGLADSTLKREDVEEKLQAAAPVFVDADLQEVESVPACNKEPSAPYQYCKQESAGERNTDSQVLDKPTYCKQEPDAESPLCDGKLDVKPVSESTLREESQYEILTPDNKEPGHASEREWSLLYEDNPLVPEDVDPRSTCCIPRSSLWHEVPISFSPTLRTTCMEKCNLGDRDSKSLTSPARSEVHEEDESFEPASESEIVDKEEPGLASDVSFSSQEPVTSADDAADHKNEVYARRTRSKRAKRKSWRAAAADEEKEVHPAKSLKQGSSKEAKNIYRNVENSDTEEVHACDLDGCTMSFGTASDLALHKRNICTIKECGKRLCNHNYLMQHYRVHVDDRPLKCDWKGCKKTFKWSWARTEHMRVHTGARPYICNRCGKSYRFVSDFSRHKRTTGHMTQELPAMKPAPHRSWRSRS